MIVRSAIVPAISLYGKPGQRGRKKPGFAGEARYDNRNFAPIEGSAGLSAPYSRPLLGGEECST